MYQQHLLTDDQVERLGEAVVETLDRVELLCQQEELLAAAEEAGARVDRVAQTISFPPAMTRELIDAQQRLPLPELGSAALPKPGLPCIGGQVAQLVYDYGTGDRRQGTRRDFVAFIKLGEMLHGQAGVGHGLLSTDVPPLVEPLEAALLLAQYASRPQPVFAWNVRQLDYLREMGAILGREEWFSLGAMCIAHPFRFDRDLADRFLLQTKAGGPIGLTAMPVAGMTTPISVAGFVTVSAAEMVASWLLGRAVNPDVPLRGSMWPGSIDMRTGEVSYCSFDAMLSGFTACELLRRWAHVEVVMGGGEYCDAKEPGYFAAWEKAYKAMTIAAFQGRHPGLGQGMLEEGKTLCAVQLLLERELASGIQVYGRRYEIDPESIDLDGIVRVGHGLAGSHLDADLTLTRFREYAWCPPFLDRSGWGGAAMDRAVLERLQARVGELLAEYRQPEVDPAKLAALRAVVERARKALL